MKLYKVICKKNNHKFDVDAFATLYEAQKCVKFYEEVAQANGDEEVVYEVEPPR